MAEYDNTDRVAWMVLGTLAGIGLGVAVGMLVAPASGEENRRHLRRKAEEARDKAKHQYDTKKDKAITALQKTADKASHAADQTQDKIKETGRRVKDEADRQR